VTRPPIEPLPQASSSTSVFDAPPPAPTRTAPPPVTTPAPASLPSVPALGAPRDEPTRAWRASELAEPTLRAEPAADLDVERERRPVAEVRRLRRGRLAIRKIDPVSVFRFSIVFQFCTMLIGLLAVGLIYAALRAVGALGEFEKFIGESLDSDFAIHGGRMLFLGFIIGCVWTIASTVVMTFGAFLYNLIADVVGGIELIVVERDDR
jgi:hypothetical protein